MIKNDEFICVCAGREPLEFNITKGAPAISFVIKEGGSYKLGIRFYVQHDIALGLKMTTSVTKFKVTVSSETHVVGSYAPKTDLQSYDTLLQVAPSGMLARGSYGGAGKVFDDDGNVYAEFGYKFDIKKSW